MTGDPARGGPVTESAFARLVGDLDRAAFASFVADLWSARGAEVTTDSTTGVLLVDPADGDAVHRVLVVGGRGGTPDETAGPDEPEGADADDPGSDAVDVVVTNAPDALASAYDATLLGPTELRRMALYALPPDVADDLFERWFDRPARTPGDGEPGPAAPTATGGGAADPGEGSDTGDPEEGGDTEDPEEGGDTGDPGRNDGTAGTTAGGDAPDGDVPGGDATDGPWGAIPGRGSRGVAALVAALVVIAFLGGFAAGGSAGLGGGPAAGATTGTPTPAPPTPTDSGSTSADATPTAGGTVADGTDGVDATNGSDGGPDTIAARYANLAPTCERPPQLVVQIQLGAIRYNDPATNAGYRTVRRFASPGNRRATGGFETFVSIINSPTYAPMGSYDRAEYGPVDVSNRSATVDVTLAGTDNGTARYRFDLSKQAADPYEGCWMTDGVIRLDDTPA